MKSEYSEFAETYPSFKERLDAFVTMVTPDPRPITLLAMQPGAAYTKQQLFHEVEALADTSINLDPSVYWTYCNGGGTTEGALHKVKAVVQVSPGRGYKTPFYSKTHIGSDFGDPLAARTLLAYGNMDLDKKSIMRTFGGWVHNGATSESRSLIIYNLIETLAHDPTRTYREADLERLTNISFDALSIVLNELGRAGVIKYHSPKRDKEGASTNSFVKYSIRQGKKILETSADTTYDEIRKHDASIKWRTLTEGIVKYIKDHPTESVTSRELSDKLSRTKKPISQPNIGRILSVLHELGYLDRELAHFEQSRAQANSNTLVLWQELLEPMGIVAHTLDPRSVPGLNIALDMYRKYPADLVSRIQDQLDAYDLERNYLGQAGRSVLRTAMLGIMPGATYKFSQIQEWVQNAVPERKLGRSTLKPLIDDLVKAGEFERVARGFYKRLKT